MGIRAGKSILSTSVGGGDIDADIEADIADIKDEFSMFNSVSIWLKSDLYLRYRIEVLIYITPHYWSCSVLIILTNKIVNSISKALTFWPFDLSRLNAWGDQQNDFHHLQKYHTAFKIRYMIGRNNDGICKLLSLCKIHLNTIIRFSNFDLVLLSQFDISPPSSSLNKALSVKKIGQSHPW